MLLTNDRLPFSLFGFQSTQGLVNVATVVSGQTVSLALLTLQLKNKVFGTRVFLVRTQNTEVTKSQIWRQTGIG